MALLVIDILTLELNTEFAMMALFSAILSYPISAAGPGFLPTIRN